MSSSPDGSTWMPRDSRTGGFLWDFASHGDYLVAAGQYGRICDSANGAEWTRAETGVTGHLTGVTYGAGTFVAVGWDGAIAQSEAVNGSAEGRRLSIRWEAGRMVVGWPRAVSGYVLQSRMGAGAGPWETVEVPVVETATEHPVTVPESALTAFFRLAR